MRLPRVRFTVRRLMVAVAVVGFALASLTLSANYSRRADYFASLQPEWVSWQSGSHSFRAKWDYWVEMEHKYRRAARYPWLPVAPDPPEPE
jgi:hypothetical protein